jgi:hypothetical protein
MATATKAQREKVHRVLHEFKHGQLRSGSKHGPKVKSKKQAIAISLSEAGLSRNKKRGKRRSGRKR